MSSQTWEYVLDVLFGQAYGVRVDLNKAVVWAAGGETCVFEPWIAKSTDKGNSWQLGYVPYPGPSNTCFSLAFHPAFSDTIYAGMEGAVVKTTDGGGTWNLTSLVGINARFTSLAVDANDPQHIWAGGIQGASPTYFKLWESFDGGGTWSTIVAPEGTPGISSLVADPVEPGVVYIATLGNGVWRYESRRPSLAHYLPLQIGNRWTFSEALTETIVDSVGSADSLFFVFDSFRHYPDASVRMTWDNKLVLKDDATEQVWLDFGAAIGDSWRVAAPGDFVEWTVFLQSKTDTVEVPAGTFFDCYRFWFRFDGCDNDWVEWYAPGVGPVKRILYGYALVEYPLEYAWVNGVGYPTRVEEEPRNSTPGRFRLYANYPNPFNSSTRISYDLATQAFVRLEIYNLSGQKVRTLTNDEKPSGYHKVRWDGTNDAGEIVASGVYLYRLTTDRLAQSRKLVFMR